MEVLEVEVVVVVGIGRVAQIAVGILLGTVELVGAQAVVLVGVDAFDVAVGVRNVAVGEVVLAAGVVAPLTAGLLGSWDSQDCPAHKTADDRQIEHVDEAA